MQQLKSHVLSMSICWWTEEFLIFTGTFDLSRQYTTHELAIPVKYSCNAGTELQVKDGYIYIALYCQASIKIGKPGWKPCVLSQLSCILYCTALYWTVLYSPIYIHCPWQCSSAAECWLAARPALARWSAQQQSVCDQRWVCAEAAPCTGCRAPWGTPTTRTRRSPGGSPTWSVHTLDIL